MAATVTGTAESWSSDTNPSSQAITVPADADAIILFIAGYDGAGSQDIVLDLIDFDGGLDANDFTQITNAQYGASNGIECSAFIITSNDAGWPGTGSQTLYWSHESSLAYGYYFGAVYVKGINFTTPTGAVDFRDSVGGDWTSSLSSCPSGDLAFVACADETPDADASASSGTGQTEIFATALFNTLGLCVGYEDGETALTVTGSSIVPLAFVVQAAAATGLNISSDFISSGSATSEPSVTSAGATVLSADAIASGNQVHEPMVSGAAVTLSVDAISSGSVLYEPFLLVYDTIESGSQLFEPTLTSVGTIPLSADFISSGNQLSEPVLTASGATVLSVDFISSGNQLFEPTFTGGVVPVSTVSRAVRAFPTSFKGYRP